MIMNIDPSTPLPNTVNDLVINVANEQDQKFGILTIKDLQIQIADGTCSINHSDDFTFKGRTPNREVDVSLNTNVLYYFGCQLRLDLGPLYFDIAQSAASSSNYNDFLSGTLKFDVSSPGFKFGFGNYVGSKLAGEITIDDQITPILGIQ